MADCKIGDLAEKYETGGKGPGFISNGSKWGDPGGDSYGSYQLESNLGTLQGYLQQDDKYTKALRGLKINSSEFKNKWRELAKQDPEGFKQSQFNYIAKKKNGYFDAMIFADVHGWETSSFALQSAIFSTCNQSGGWRTIFESAGIKQNVDSVEKQINKLYNARAKYFKHLNLAPMIKKNIIKQRTVEERKDCLRLIGE